MSNTWVCARVPPEYSRILGYQTWSFRSYSGRYPGIQSIPCTKLQGYALGRTLGYRGTQFGCLGHTRLELPEYPQSAYTLYTKTPLEKFWDTPKKNKQIWRKTSSRKNNKKRNKMTKNKKQKMPTRRFRLGAQTDA